MKPLCKLPRPWGDTVYRSRRCWLELKLAQLTAWWKTAVWGQELHEDIAPDAQVPSERCDRPCAGAVSGFEAKRRNLDKFRSVRRELGTCLVTARTSVAARPFGAGGQEAKGTLSTLSTPVIL